MNKLRSFITTQFGGNAATDLRTAATIVGPEIIKAIGVAGSGTAVERLAQEAFMSPNVSAEQMKGSIKALTELLGGQLKTKMTQGAMAGVDEGRFKKLVGERPFEILTGAAKEIGGGGETPVRPQRPPGVPADALYSKSKNMWKSGNTIYDASGKKQ